MPNERNTGSRRTATAATRAKEDLGDTVAYLEATLRSAVTLSSHAKWYPHGINKLSAEVKTPAVTISIEVSGPGTGIDTSFVSSPRSTAERSYTTFDDTTVPVEAVLRPPAPRFFASAPTEGTSTDQDKLSQGKTIEGAAKIFARLCDGGDTYDNNCAHFLSNAFIDAGYADLRAANDCINARCATTAKRPIRAKDMLCWFKSSATNSGSKVSPNTGFWAVFQLDEAQYPGGHVVIIDSNTWKYYGTGWYDDWTQQSFQW